MDRNMQAGIHPVEEVPQTPVAQALSTLSDEIDRIFSCIELHRHKVEPVMGPDPGQAPGDRENPMRENSELVRYIIDQAARVRSARNALSGLTDRIEL